jgi:hypothetical protein
MFRKIILLPHLLLKGLVLIRRQGDDDKALFSTITMSHSAFLLQNPGKSFLLQFTKEDNIYTADALVETT